MEIKSALVVGGGAMAVDHHLPRLKKFLRAPRISLFEVNAHRRDQLRRRFRLDWGVRVVDRLPEDESFDLVVISTPPKFHFEYFERLAGQSENFFIEKPMTMNMEEASNLESLAAALGKSVYVNMIRRTLRSYSLIKQVIHSGDFGTLKRVNVADGSVLQWSSVSKGSFSRELNGGGVLMDTGPHTIDLMFRLFDDLAFRACVMDGEAPAIEANCQLSLVGSNGVPVEILLSRNRYLSNLARFEFTDAVLEVGVLSEMVHVKERSGRQQQMFAEGVTQESTWSGLVDQYYEKHLAHGDNSDVGPTESRRVAGILDQAYAEATFVAGAF